MSASGLLPAAANEVFNDLHTRPGIRIEHCLCDLLSHVPAGKPK